MPFSWLKLLCLLVGWLSVCLPESRAVVAPTSHMETTLLFQPILPLCRLNLSLKQSAYGKRNFVTCSQNIRSRPATATATSAAWAQQE